MKDRSNLAGSWEITKQTGNNQEYKWRQCSAFDSFLSFDVFPIRKIELWNDYNIWITRNYYKKRFQLFRTTSVFSFLSFFLSYDVGLVRLEQAKRGRSWVFKVTASQHPSATLWGWTPDSEGEPCSSISTLLHFLSLKLQVPKGAWESILISGGWVAFLLCLKPPPRGRSVYAYLFILIALI